MSTLVEQLMLSPQVQIAVKMLRLPQLANGLLRVARTTRKLPGSELSCRVRFSDTLLLIDGLFRGGEYAVIEPHAASIKTFIDLGCNVGLFPLYLCTIRNDREISGLLVDANPEVVEEARANLRINQLDHQVHVVHGLADAGTVGTGQDFFVTPNSLSSTKHGDMLGSKYGAQKIEVPVVDVLAEFDRRFGEQTPIDLLKLDIEGCEEDFLSTNGALLERCSRVVLEFHKPKATLRSVGDLLSASGYRLHASRDDSSLPWGIAYFTR